MRIYRADSLPDPTSRLAYPYYDTGIVHVGDKDDRYIKIMDLRATEDFIVPGKDKTHTFKSVLHITTTGWLRWGDLKIAPPGLVTPGLIKIT